jgi:hypothetical protein
MKSISQKRCTRFDNSNIKKGDAEKLKTTECLTFPMDSREVNKDIAYERVYDIVKIFKNK